MKILLEDLNAKVRRGDIFRRTIRSKKLHEIRGDNGISVVNFAT
jgi:hypothetical protein